MNRLSIFAAAIAAVVVIASAIALVRQPSADPGGAQTPSPSVPGSAGDVPPELRFIWLGDLREVEGLPTDRSILGFQARSAHYIEELVSTASSRAAGEIELSLDAANIDARCEAGDAGTYRYTLSPGGTKLTLTKVSDACAARADAISGDWLRSKCSNPNNFCLGPLEAGDYASFFLAPRIADNADWAPDFGAIRYTVPTGWAATADFPRDYFLEPAGWYAENGGDIASETRGIYVGSHVAALEPGPSCEPALADGVARSADAIAAWLARHPALAATKPTAITVGGVPGVYVDGAAAEDAVEICRAAPTPVALLFGEAGVETGGRAWGAQAGHRARWILLDLDPGRPILVTIEGRDDVFDALLAEAMPIVQSFRFE